ncbi:MAG: linked oxidase domain protein [Actinomycetia bacterium]|nr:linked oxidase domain protein [Actinomycetes bacterium]
MASGRLRIRLLGGLDLRQDEVALPPLGSARAESLLAFLLLHQEAPQPRQHLAFLLWPDSSEGQARTNLRHLLHVLRRALLEPDRFLEVTPRTLRWRPDAPCWLDVAAFDAAVARSEREPGGSEAALSEAVELYAGDLLQGSYDEWLAEERERLRQRYLQALERLVELLEARGDLPAATRRAERLLREDPLREPTYQALMRLHDARGDRARALRVYHACAATLARELGVEPSAATRRAYASLLPPRVEPATPDQPSPLGPAGAAPLIGRAGQRASLVDLWRRSERGAAQLALVTGEPGAGKTRLVEELRAWCARSGAATAEARSYPAEGALAYGPGPIVLGGPVFWRLDDAAKVLRRLRDYAPEAPDELGMTVAMMLAPPLPFLPPEQLGKPVLGLVLVWSGEPAAGRRAIAPLLGAARPVAELVRPVPYLAIQSMLDGGAPKGRHYYWRSHRLPGLPDQVIDALLDQLASVTSPFSQVNGWAMGGAVSRADPEATAVGEREVGFDLSFAAAWPAADPDGEGHTAWARRGWEALAPHSAGVYVNFISDEGPAGVETAYGQRLKRLTALKDRWDPTNLFRMNANIPPSQPGRR